MLDFAYHLTIGNLDEAFKAIKLIKRFLIRISLCTFNKISRYAVGLRNIIIGNSPIIIRSGGGVTQKNPTPTLEKVRLG